ncbi:MAG: ABC transporter permease subunit [Deltaproteobacteria bacterium]|nr:ABC transporter permease subunit [Deltaproteobacteria bacterium]
MSPLWLSLEVATLATALVVVVGLPTALALLHLPKPASRVLEVFLLLPLVVPPSVTGLALLWLLGQHGPLGALSMSLFGETPLFTAGAAVVASAAIAFPLFLRSARAALEEVPVRQLQLARVLGDTWLRATLRVHLPLARRGILAGVALAFGRALGEFGATLMVAGNIPGRTETLALAVYGHWLVGEDAQAWAAAALLAGAGIIVLALVSRWEGARA